MRQGASTRAKKPLHRLLIVTLATVVLLVVGGIDRAQHRLGQRAAMSMLPFFAVLAVASIGQHLVIQQRGLDLSVAGIMSFAAVIGRAYPGSTPGLRRRWPSSRLRSRWGLVSAR